MWGIDSKQIRSIRYRGQLLDAVVFCVNLFFFLVLARLFSETMQEANRSFLPKLAIGIFCLAPAFLQPVGAILKRRCARQRKPGVDLGSAAVVVGFVYFVAQLFFLIGGSALILESASDAYGRDYSTPLFGVLFLAIPAVAIANTAVVLFYFRTPKHPPVFSFLASNRAENTGDLFLFLNMICFQMFWGYLASQIPHDYASTAGRLSQLGFTSLLIYFPPRLFYLVEDGSRPAVWLTIFISNLPLLIYVVFANYSRALPAW
jgi:hypothetical protein